MSAIMFSPKFIFVAIASICFGAGTLLPPQENAATSGVRVKLSDQDGAVSDSAASDSKSQQEKGKQDKSKKDEFEPIFEGWKKPDFALFISGRQHGYIEPCGCTGLDQQKGGMLRRDTLRRQLLAKGWSLIPIDAGNQIRRFGAQPFIKLGVTWDALAKIMDYQAIAFGPEDLKTPDVDLLQSIENAKVKDKTRFVAANVNWIEEGFSVPYRIIKVGDFKVGVTAILGDQFKKSYTSDVFTVEGSEDSLKAVWPKMAAERCDAYVLVSHSTIEHSEELAKKFPHFNVLITTGGAGEPKQAPDEIKVGNHVTNMVQVGKKGMFVGVIGFFQDKDQWSLRYQRVPMDHRFKDSDAIKKVFKGYQDELRVRGLKNLGIKAVSRRGGRKYVGSDACKDCHADAYDIWKNGNDKKGGPHFRATKDLTDPGERTWVKRHHDPECLSCHVTGWNPQQYFPYESGYMKLDDVELHGSGCENCHGPGSLHVDAENGDIDVDEETQEKYMEDMIVTLETAKRDLCMSCHDLDNSPDFDFEKYWEKIKHYEE